MLLFHALSPYLFGVSVFAFEKNTACQQVNQQQP
jgi:hypothetical protein